MSFNLTMMEMLLSGPMLPFTIALAIVAGLMALEVLSLLLGFAAGQFLDAAIDIDADTDLPDALEWIGLGTVPIMVLVPIFLTAFGLGGIGFQSLTGSEFSPWLAAVPALLAAILATRLLGRALGNVLGKSETTAMASDALVGHTGIITLGTTRAGEPSQAKLRDKHGQTHYVLVEPIHAEEKFESGERVILIRREGPKYFVVADDPEAIARLDGPDLVADVRREAKEKDAR